MAVDITAPAIHTPFPVDFPEVPSILIPAKFPVVLRVIWSAKLPDDAVFPSMTPKSPATVSPTTERVSILFWLELALVASINVLAVPES